MVFSRTVWLIYFAIGAAALVGFFDAFHQWALTQAVPGAEAFCQGTIGGSVPLARAPTCLALWFVEAMSWMRYAGDVVLQIGHGLSAMELVRTADVGLFAIGGLALAGVLNCIWASAATQVTMAVVAGLYSLVQGLAQMLGRRTA